MASQFTHDFFKGLHTEEFALTERLDGSINVPATALIALAGVGFYFLRIWPKEAASITVWAFWVLVMVFVICWMAGVIFLILTIWPRERAFLTTPMEQQGYVDGLREFHESENAHRITDVMVENDFRDGLIVQYIQAAEDNRNVNRAKMGWLTWTKRLIAASIAVMFLNGYPTFVVQRLPTESQRVKIESVPDINVNILDKEQKDGRKLTNKVQASTPKASATEDHQGLGRGSSLPKAAEKVKRVLDEKKEPFKSPKESSKKGLPDNDKAKAAANDQN